MGHLLSIAPAGISRILVSGLEVVPAALGKLVANIATMCAEVILKIEQQDRRV
jgi:hypothetical protein